MKVLLDACVLYPTVMREVLLGAAKRGLYTPLWSARILEEWARAARKLGPQGEAQARGEVALTRAAFPKAEVKEHKGLEARLYLKDENDIHVLSAAIAGGAEAIVTMNAQDFPRHVLAEEGLERWDPDGFLWRLWSDHPEAVAEVVEEVRQEAERLSGEVWDVRRLMKKARLPRLGKALS
ncbi:RSP_2648 family PIN domain-containing protein [Celeribacter sp.]|uniref:RSP_2648 family PIN domain-containing protein n=1 Tax=Celeribacter sp. TaxID=1890673 RepID=UPI003A94C614